MRKFNFGEKRKIDICEDAGLTSDYTFRDHLDFPVNIGSKCDLITWTKVLSVIDSKHAFRYN